MAQRAASVPVIPKDIHARKQLQARSDGSESCKRAGDTEGHAAPEAAAGARILRAVRVRVAQSMLFYLICRFYRFFLFPVFLGRG